MPSAYRSIASFRRVWMGVFIVSMALTVGTHAQQTTRPAAPPHLPDTPHVHADRTVTFYFPDLGASEVRLSLSGNAHPLPMEKDSQGVWSLTVGPLQPAIYNYEFVVDGVPLLDPSNPSSVPNLRNPTNVLEVPGPEPELWDVQEVPHGVLWERISPRPFLHSTRRMPRGCGCCGLPAVQMTATSARLR